MLGGLSGDLFRVKKLSSADPPCGRRVGIPAKDACLPSLWLVFSSARPHTHKEKEGFRCGYLFSSLIFFNHGVERTGRNNMIIYNTVPFSFPLTASVGSEIR